jgi:hypothetical protein
VSSSRRFSGLRRILLLGVLWCMATGAKAQNSCVNSSTWPVQGGFVHLRGDYRAEIYGTIPDLEAALLPVDVGGISNAFTFVGRIQDLVSFQADYEVYCTGGADAIFFYFGAQSPPATEENSESFHAFTVANSIFTGRNYPSGSGQMVVSYQSDLDVLDYTPFVSTMYSWIPMRVTYSRSGSSITVSVEAQGSLMLTTVVGDASAWLVNQSGSYWGIAARTGAVSGTFSFRRLSVQASDCTYLGLACLLGSCNLDSCGARTYSTSQGR